MTLYEECIEVLKDTYKILLEDEKNKVLKDFQDKFEFTNWGRIDWNKISQKVQVDYASKIKSKLNISKSNMNVYIIWDEITLPVIESDLYTVIEVIDDVTAVSFDTWLFSPNEGVVIEFHHDGEIIIGINR